METNPLDRLAVHALMGGQPQVRFWQGYLRGWEAAKGHYAPAVIIDVEIQWGDTGVIESQPFGVRSSDDPTDPADHPADDQVFFWLTDLDLIDIAKGDWLGDGDWCFTTVPFPAVEAAP